MQRRADFDPGAGLAFSANGEGNVTQETADKYSNLQTVETEPGARTMAVDPKTHPNNDPNPSGLTAWECGSRNFWVLVLGM
jgi:hypothetical protein